MELFRPVLGVARASKPLRTSPRALSQRIITRQRPLHQLSTSRLRNPRRNIQTAAPSQLLNRPFQHFNSISSESQPQSEGSNPPANEEASKRVDVPAYDLTFTCKPCLTRATHRISKQGYHQGTVLITCPNCRARHLISDHLKIFKDDPTTIEDILREKGDVLKKGTLGENGDIEFWQDGTGSVTVQRTRGEVVTEKEQKRRG